MKALVLIIGFIAVNPVWAQRAPICTVDTVHLNFCQRMKHLHSTVKALDSQPALMQVNYPYLDGMAKDLEDNTTHLISLLPNGLADHKATLLTLKELSNKIRLQASQKNSDAFVTSNSVGAQCMSCHATRNPSSPIAWNDLFGNGWDQISKDCARDGANPYLCKTMNGLMTNFGHIVTAYVAKTDNYEALSTVSQEILRLLGDLGQKNFTHIPDDLRVSVESQVQEVLKMSERRDPLVFERARDLNNACMQCHNKVASNNLGSAAMGDLHFIGARIFGSH